MLTACKTCHRQYDVQGMSPGERVRCRCGELLEVPVPRPREARVLHCSGCGGKLRDASRKCDYCGAEITRAERNQGPPCPECFARLSGGARFCSDCGVEIRPEALRATRAAATCPRCKGGLTLCELEHGQYTECGACGGIWLDAASFEKVLETRDASALAGAVRSGSPERVALEAESLVKYVPCPVCGNLMHRKNFAGCSGIILDWCKGHGFWFDAEELPGVIAFINQGGLDRARANEIRRQRQELDRLKDAERRAVARSRSAPPPRSYNQGPDLFDLFDVVEGLGMVIKALFTK